MENYTTVRAILDKARQWHRKQGDLYADLARNVEDMRVSFLAQQLSRHEREFEEKLHDYSLLRVDRFLDTWLQFSPDEGVVTTICNQAPVSPDTSIKQVGELANRFDQALVEYFLDAARHIHPGNVRELFLSLAEVLRLRKSMHAFETVEAWTIL